MANVDGEKTPSQILRDAAGYIREHGWCQGNLADGTRRCMVGAVKEVGCPHHAFGDWTDGANAAWLALSESVATNPAYWNDKPERTVEQVIAALESAAASLESA